MNRRKRKSAKMRQVEQERGRPIECLLANRVQEVGMSAASDELGISKASISYWLMKLDVTVERVALLPGDIVEIKRGDAWARDAVMPEKQRIVV